MVCRADHGEELPHVFTDVDVGGAVADVTAVEAGVGDVEACVDGVAGAEYFGTEAVTVGGEDGVAKG